MEQYYLLLVILLLVFAVSDLVVGVSNDAVNFLNSAIGSRVTSRNKILLVASIGIFIGATFSSGMMEVARKGIFHPDQFYFYEIMSIFLAVMLTDIILLDIFNTFGLPTSTTVSIVFELLGAAVVISLVKMSADGVSITEIDQYINASKAGVIILGIFLSVIFAFALGSFLQYLSRIIFTFEFEKRLRSYGGVWSGFAFTALTYFLLIKGVKGASFVSSAEIAWVQDHAFIILTVSFIIWSSVFSILALRGYNILKAVVLFGTFTLAMAFASNDLVNFIGVPIAGFESYHFWSDSGVPSTEFTMEALKEPVQTPTLYLFIAGAIMVITLWVSRKARSVTETEVDLARQDEGLERFKPFGLARSLVRFSAIVGKRLGKYFPSVPDNNGRSIVVKRKPSERPAFDLVRASVNLTMASILISFATSLKLPLSTTYVSFMVAMGSSLADKAWDRDSAVFRVSGVLNVIGGWFLTAAIAFGVAGTFAFVIIKFGIVAVLVIVGLALLIIANSFIIHRRRAREKKEELDLIDEITEKTGTQAVEDSRENVVILLNDIRKIFENSFDGLIKEDRELLQELKEAHQKFAKTNKKYSNNIITYLKSINEEDNNGARLLIKVFDTEQDLRQSISLIFDVIYNHVENLHKPLKDHQCEEYGILKVQVSEFLKLLSRKVDDRDFLMLEDARREKDALIQNIEHMITAQIKGIKEDIYSSRNSRLTLSLLLETRDLVAEAVRLVNIVRSSYHVDLAEEIS